MFQELPLWQRATVAASYVVAAPAILVIGALVGLSVLPLVVLERFETKFTYVHHRKEKQREARAHDEQAIADMVSEGSPD
jgi:hypothetical protein